MILTIILLIIGLAILTAGAEGLVRGASGLARAFGLSPLIIGLTVVAFGTSAPELAVSLKAALSGTGDIMIGNVVGSNIFNVAVILGLAALIAPLSVHHQVLRLDMPIMLAASLVFTGFCFLQDGLARWEGGLLFGAMIVYLWFLIRISRRDRLNEPAPEEGAAPRNFRWLDIVWTVIGLAMLVVGARLMVDQATILATTLGVSDAIIGLTIVAAGTSLPELATSVVAAIRRETDMAVGNIVGSNLFNLLSIGGLTSIICPVRMSGIGLLDFTMMLATSLLLLPLMWSGLRIARWEGGLLLALWIGYLWLRLPT